MKIYLRQKLKNSGRKLKFNVKTFLSYTNWLKKLRRRREFILDPGRDEDENFFGNRDGTKTKIKNVGKENNTALA